MVHIKKKDVPAVFSDNQKKYKTYDALNDSEIKSKLKEILIKEQGGICAYCMVGIDLEKSTIEHYIPRNGINGNQSLSLDYNNMLAVCSSSRGENKANQHCDVSKGDRLLKIDPRNEQHIAQIGYKSDGEIYSDVPDFDNDLNNVLQLNLTILKNNRKSALNAALATFANVGTSKENLQSAIEYYSRPNIPFVGIIRWMFNKKQEQINKNT